MSNSDTVRNFLELQLFGLQRSGNHAIASWLFQQFQKPVVFLNNVQPFSDPFIFCRACRIPNSVRLGRAGPDQGRARIELIRNRRKDVLVLSYENLNLPILKNRRLIEDRNRFVGKSSIIRRVFLFRDFYNWLASRIKLFEFRGASPEQIWTYVGPHIDLWLVYAREFAGMTSFLSIEGHPVTKISYNSWVRSEQYRREVLSSLGIALKNNAIDTVPNVGGGSSFDSLSMSGRATEMNVEQRWKYLTEPKWDPILELLQPNREEIDTLNAKIFQISRGDIAGLSKAEVG